MNILAFGIHPDDIELGCAGTLIIAADAGHSVTLADLSDGAAASNGTVEERQREAQTAAGLIGARERVNLALPDAHVRSEDPEHVRRCVDIIRKTRPDLVVLPSSDDPHPDHASGGWLIQRAMYLSGVHGYLKDTPAWKVGQALVYPGRNDLRPDIVFDITSVFDRKLAAVRAHETQFGAAKGNKPTPLNDAEFFSFLEGRHRVHGRFIDVRYGEGFTLWRPLHVVDPSVLVPPGTQ